MIISQKTGYIKNALYISYTSLNDFLKCPRAYYLKNIYRNPKNGFKLQIASPYLTLGSTVHDAIKWFLELEEKVGKDELIKTYKNFWQKYRGKRGGFVSLEEEGNFGKRGLMMLENFLNNVHVLEKPLPPVVFPKYNLVEDVILIGNFDFVGEREDGTLHIVDFKTGAKDEEETLQLYIYAILAESNLQRPVSAASFWYLDREDTPREIVLDPLEPKLEWLKQKALEIKQAITNNSWVCIRGDQTCRDCSNYQAIIDGKGAFQFSDYRYKKDIYFLKK